MPSRTCPALVFTGALRGAACETPPTAPDDFEQYAGFAAVNGTPACIGGAVTRTSDENVFPLGGGVLVPIQDNGEGSADSPDLMSFLRLAAPASICSQQRRVGMPFTWLHGNVRAR